jgi:hypothetical protein
MQGESQGTEGRCGGGVIACVPKPCPNLGHGSHTQCERPVRCRPRAWFFGRTAGFIVAVLSAVGLLVVAERAGLGEAPDRKRLGHG